MWTLSIHQHVDVDKAVGAFLSKVNPKMVTEWLKTDDDNNEK